MKDKAPAALRLVETIVDSMRKEAEEAAIRGESFDPSWVVGYADLLVDACRRDSCDAGC